MAIQRRRSVALVPGCDVMETRLALSGNFLSHGFADVSRSVEHLSHHHVAERATMTHDQTDAAGTAMKVHHHHINEAAK